MLFISIRDRSKRQTTINLARRATWYKNWELYPIILFAVFLRFYKINTSEFDFDQALIYRMAYDAVHHGLWPVTNSTASLGFANAPGELYLLMLPAAFSANPIYGFYLVSLLASISVLITYIFTTRYYGRLAGAIATLLYATAAIPLFYARFLWQPNLMYVFVILFMFTLFIGVVERRKGWFGPALILLGLLYQTHGTTLTLAVPLVLACCMALKTIRWRDLLYGIIGLAVVFFPFMLWQLVTHFSDLQLILAQNTKPAILNDVSWQLYRLMMSPYNLQQPPSSPLSVAGTVLTVTAPLSDVLCGLVIIGCVLAWVSISRGITWRAPARQRPCSSGTRRTQGDAPTHFTSDAGGLLLLCAWQITPIIALIKHASNLYPQYMLIVLPGPFILISYIVVVSGKRARSLPVRFWTYLHGTVTAILAIVMIFQLINSVAILQDYTYGYIPIKGYTQYNTLYSQQKMLDDAEHLAQHYHLKRILIGADTTTAEMMLYFSEHMHYPTSVFLANQCMLLPAPSDGPAILVMLPSLTARNQDMEAQGAHLLEQATLLNSKPFRIYELPTTQKNVLPTTQQNTFPQNLQMVRAGYQNSTKTSLATSWSLLRSYPLSDNTTYSYHFTALANGQPLMESTCTFNMAYVGDQLQPSFAIPALQVIPTQVSMSVQAYETNPDRPVLGPFHLETHRLFDSRPGVLRTPGGKDAITLDIEKPHL